MADNSGKEFEIPREFEVGASPEQVWEAVTNGTGGWLWPMEYEPKEGGAGPFHSVLTTWDPPHRLTVRSEDPAALPPFQTLNQLDYTIEARDGGSRAWVRYVHSGIFTDNWDEYYDGADKHTDFYLHTLREYVTHFAGRPVAFATFDGPGASANREALGVAGRALGLPDDAAQGARVRVQGPDGRTLDAVLDYRDAYFIGLRTDDALYRFFGRGPWGAPVGISVHDFAADADAGENERAWSGWLASVFG
ncbi:SRPBCC domain-containing protein [Streptomyces sp. SID14478]|uniref:SRPBCC family protein n=1 Tax=Streptomyces sp. SID14478 TaxID=2706073 RepID=UPI0013DC1BCA|nr:SRPBCC domain-containing protein [Streptomyces sp. SID14478]NEB78509.1 SRPBCC domain-containing protein [Streptomyces sp. SID14478]